MKVVFIANRRAGPYTIHGWDQTYLAISHRGPFISDQFFSHSEAGCIEKLKEKFGENNVNINEYENSFLAAQEITGYLGLPHYQTKIIRTKKIRLVPVLGLGFWKIPFKGPKGLGGTNYYVQIPFLQFEFGTFKMLVRKGSYKEQVPNEQGLKIGDPVFWNDPDNGFASGIYHVKAIPPDASSLNPDSIITIGNDSTETEVYYSELVLQH